VIQQHSICNNTFCLATSNDVDEAISTLHSRTYEYMTGGGGGGRGGGASMRGVHNVDTKKKCLNFGTPRTEELEETCIGVKKKGYEYYRWIKFGARAEKKKKDTVLQEPGSNY
jgi:hypothetical protein